MILLARNAFTLIELMVWISILWILAFWATSINLDRLSSKQELEIFTNNITTNFESVRNYSLSWKWIWINLDVPSKWKIDYSWNWSWTIITSTSYDWTNWIDTEIINFQWVNYISEIKCWGLNEEESLYNILNSSWTWSIIFDWAILKLDTIWDINCDPLIDRILELTVNNKLNSKIIKINTVNWIIQTK